MKGLSLNIILNPKSLFMLRSVLVLTFILGNIFNLKAQVSPNDLGGTWQIDLRPKPDAEAYYKVFKVSLEEDSFSGEFYNTDFKNGRLNTVWSELYFAFETKSGRDEYYHSGYLKGDTLYGMSHCPQRKFVMPWKGVKTK